MTNWHTNMTKEEFIRENNITNRTFLQVNTNKNSGGYYGSTTGWIGHAKLEGYYSSNKDTKIKLIFGFNIGTGDLEYLPSELRKVTLQDLLTMSDKNLSLSIFLQSDMHPQEIDWNFVQFIKSCKILEWSLNDDKLIVDVEHSTIRRQTIRIITKIL